VSSDNLVPALECARDPDVSLLVGYLGGVPASTAILFVIGQVAGLTGVATVPEYRRRGLAEALTWAASGDVVHASISAVGRALL
jgi:ribosomal protein S18 acetylase RimI-like enzyme